VSRTWRPWAERKRHEPGQNRLGNVAQIAELRDELLNGEIFYSLRVAKVVIERWRIHYNTRRPHSALGCGPPVTVTIAPPPALDGTANRQ